MNKIIFIYIIGIILRLSFAYSFYGSLDVDNAWYITEQYFSGQNIYETTSYNHTPIWLSLLIVSRHISSFSNLPFYFVMKIYAIIADLTITVLIYKISKKIQVKSEKTSYFLSLIYFFSPVSALISSFHGQFDSIPIALLLASFYYLKHTKKDYFKISAFLFGLAIAFKTWPILLLPLYLLLLKNTLRKKILFTSISLITFFLPIVPYLFISPIPTFKNIFMYFGTADFGLAVFIELFNNIKKEPLYSLSKLIYSNPFYGILLLLFSLLIALVFINKKKLNFFDSSVLFFLSIYVFSLKLGAQYLLWIIPFAILTKYRKIVVFYTLITTLTLIASYQGHNSRALGSIPNMHLPWGIIASLWWLTCVMWYIYILKKQYI